MSAIKAMAEAIIGPSEEEITAVGHELLRESEALALRIERNLSRVVTVRDMLIGKFDCGVNFSVIDATRKRARAMLAQRPQATFVYQNSIRTLAGAFEEYESATSMCEEWRPK